MLQEFVETIECITTFGYQPRTYHGGNLLVVLCLVDRTPVEIEWRVPLARLGLFIHWFVIGMIENMIT
jgi:hypothetical protein